MASAPWARSPPAPPSVSPPARFALLMRRRLTGATVFETELVAIAGVPKPDKIKTKAAGEKVSENISTAAGEAAGVVKDMLTDAEDIEHAEL